MNDPIEINEGAVAGSSPVPCSPLVWKIGPARGGGGTAGSVADVSQWWDGDALLVIVELKDGSRDVAYLHVFADEGSVEFRDHNGDHWGWEPEDVSWFCQMDKSHFPWENAEVSHGDRERQPAANQPSKQP